MAKNEIPHQDLNLSHIGKYVRVDLKNTVTEHETLAAGVLTRITHHLSIEEDNAPITRITVELAGTDVDFALRDDCPVRIADSLTELFGNT